MSTTSIRQAAEQWTDGFDRIPGYLFEKLAEADESIGSYASESLRLVASPRAQCQHCDATYGTALTSEPLQTLPCPNCEKNLGGDWFPGRPSQGFLLSSTLFAPRDRLDREWLLEYADEVAELGIFVFRSEDFGCLLGIDEACLVPRAEGSSGLIRIDADGTSFLKALWMPLYQLRFGSDDAE